MSENLAKTVIEAFGGLTETYRATGVKIPTIQSWKKSGRIPEWRRPAILAAAAKKGVTLPKKFGLVEQDLVDVAKEQLTQLSHQTDLPAGPDEATLERIANPHAGTAYLARYTCPEFTALCPITGQPDFAHLVIDYAPDGWLVESKSLKLYLGSFRNHGHFHEDCTVAIAKRLESLLEPVWLRIGGYWYPRGGMPIDVFYQSGPPPEGLWIPDQGVAPYRGRG